MRTSQGTITLTALALALPGLACSTSSSDSGTAGASATGGLTASGTASAGTTGASQGGTATMGGGTTSTGGSGTAGNSSGTAGASSSGGTTMQPPVFDLGAIPDAGGMGPVGIPETCEEAVMVQSTVGCSFHANKMQNFIEEPTSLVIGNVSQTMDVTAQLYFGTGGGSEQPEGAPVVVGPGMTYEFILNKPPEPGDVTVLRDGGAFRVETDLPVVAYQHSPISAVAHNDSSMLIPDHALGKFHVVASWQGNIGSPSMFNVVGVEPQTMVTWTPPNGSSAGGGIAAVAPGGMGMAAVGALDLLQVISSGDMSGTIVETSKPAWVVGAVPCVNIPSGVTFCDHIEELLIPLEYWGTSYVGAHAPTRGNESYWWRIYSGADGVTVTTTPPQAGTPVLLDRGEFHEFSTKESFMISADGPIMPVQYLEGQNGGAGTGDPASYQMVPTEQFLPRYVFVTGKGYTENYVQVIRPTGAPDVLVDGAVVTGYVAVGGFEVADWSISEGSHVAASDEPFGITVVGYTNVTSYAYPGGLALGFINPNPEG